MLLTPTYDVFEMYKGQQDATLLPSALSSEQYAGPTAAQKQAVLAGQYPTPSGAIGQLSASASRDAAGNVLLTLCNLHHENDADLAIGRRGMTWSTVTGCLLTAPTLNAMNTFDQPDAVGPEAFESFRQSKACLTVSLPPRSVVAMKVQ